MSRELFAGPLQNHRLDAAQPFNHRAIFLAERQGHAKALDRNIEDFELLVPFSDTPNQLDRRALSPDHPRVHQGLISDCRDGLYLDYIEAVASVGIRFALKHG